MKVIEFGPFQLNPESVRLLKDGVEIELEPQVFNALLLLVNNSDRVVSKEEMFDKLWQGRTLTDHVITRIIYELRKVLDDKNSDHSYIRTVRGKGYQFVHIIKDLEPKAKKQKTSVDNRPFIKWLWLIPAVLVSVVMVFLVQNNISNTNSEPVSKHPIFAVLPIEVVDLSDEVSVFSYSIIDQVTAQIGVNLKMRVIHPDSMMALRDQFYDLWAIQKATRADYILEGQLAQYSETSIKIRFTLHKVDDKGQLTPFLLGDFMFPYPATSKDLKELYKQQRITVREIVQLIKPGVTIRMDGYNETDDPEAYRMVLQAHHLMRRDYCEEIFQSERLLKKATESDPDFAYAWYQLFAHYFKLVYVCGQSTENYQTALQLAEKVEQLAPGKYRAVTIARNVILTESNQVEMAYQYVADADWNNPVMLNMKVYALRYAGFLHLASEHIERILQLDPFFYSKKPIYQAPNSLLFLNRFEAHLALLAEPGNAYHDFYRGLNRVVSGHPEEAVPILQAVHERTPDDLFGQFSHALFLAITDEHIKAKQVIDDIAKQRQEKQHFDGEMAYKLAQLYALSGYSEEAIKQFEMAVNHGFFAYAYFVRDPALDSIRKHPSFDNIVQQAAQRHLAFAQQFNLEPEIGLPAK